MIILYDLRHGLPNEQEQLCINGNLAIQRCLHFETLIADLSDLVMDLSLP